jgi:hypothetical protein
MAASKAEDFISQIQTDVLTAQDNLLQAKIFQEHYTNMNCLCCGGYGYAFNLQ